MFNSLFNDATPEQPDKKDDKDGDAPKAVAVFVPAQPKQILPVTFKLQGGQDAATGNSPGQASTDSVETAAAVGGDAAVPQPAGIALDAADLQEPLDAPKAPTQELAFAGKLTEAAPAAPPAQAQTAQQQLPRVTPVARTTDMAPAKPAAQQQRTPDASEHHATVEPAAQSYISAQSPAPAEASTSAAPRSVSAAPPTAAVEPVAQPAEKPAAPMNEITLHVSNADQTSTSIRMVDRSGELHVAVRASDPQMAESLRGNVEQLTSKLSSNGFSAEVYKPSAITAAARTQESSQQMSQGQQGSRHESNSFLNRDQQNKKKYPDWVEELYADS